MTLEEVVESQAQQVQVVNNEVERLKQQLAWEKKSASDTSMELRALKAELEKSKTEAEHLKSIERSFEDRRYARSKTRLELEDANNTIAELKEELAYKSSVNRSLGLQLEKTIESNSELLLEIKDLDDLLQSKEKEIEELKAGSGKRERNQEVDDDDEKAMCLVKLEESKERKKLDAKLEESEKERKKLDAKLEESEKERKKLEAKLEEIRRNELSDDGIHELRVDNVILRKELEKAETEIANTSKENMNLLSQLMALRHQTDEKHTMVQQLEQRMALEQEQSLIQIEALEKKAQDLQATVNELKEKLRLSEELSQSQLDSNKVFMEDLISTVEGLRARNEKLEDLLKSSEETHSSLIEELEAHKQELMEHEKERSLLASQRGQLKTLRERIATLTESYAIATERGAELELAIEALKEEHRQALAHFDQQLRDREEKLQDVDAECLALKAEMQKAEAQAAETKEAAEANANKVDATYMELRTQYDLLQADKESVSASLSSLKVAHDELEEHLKNAQDRGDKAIHQLQERDIKIIELTEALNGAENQLRKACEATSELEATTLTLQEELQRMQEEGRLQNEHMADLQLKLVHLTQELHESSRSLSASEERVQNLQVRTTDLSEMLQSAVSYKEDVVSRLETALAKEHELEAKLQETQEALMNLRSEKLTHEQTIQELEERIRLFTEEKTGSVKVKGEDGDARELHKIQRTRLEVLKNSMAEMKLEKDKAESSVQKLQANNMSLAQELRKWKEKVKAGNEELAVWKDKVKTSKHLSNSLEEKTSHVPDSNLKGPKKSSSEVDQKSEVLKLRKQAADLRRRLLEQEEEKEDMRKKLLSFQKEVQKKSELMSLTEKKLKEKEKEQHVGQRPPTRHSSGVGHRIGMANSNMLLGGGKTTADLVEKVKALEAELNIKTVELEATQFLLKKKDVRADGIEKDEGVDAHIEINKPEEDLQSQNPEVDQQQLVMDVGTLRALQDEVQRLQVENQRLMNFHLEHKDEEKNSPAAPSRGSSQRLRKVEREEEETHLREELREMKEMYSQLSLQFAELQIEKEELLVAMKGRSKDGHR